MTKEKRSEAFYDTDTRRYIYFMCRKGCKFYDMEQGCTKNRVVRDCVKKNLKNKE